MSNCFENCLQVVNQQSQEQINNYQQQKQNLYYQQNPQVQQQIYNEGSTKVARLTPTGELQVQNFV